VLLTLAILACLAAALVCAGLLYQWLGGLRDRRRFGKLGRWIDIGNGCRIYIREKGSGSATVIFESGIAASSLNWANIQEQVAAFATTISYDRLGLGWSSPCSAPRTPAHVAAELHKMLECAGVRPPYVLVGHSFGGQAMRRFSLEFPNEVAGMVLVDPMRLDEWPPLNPAKQAMLDRGQRLARTAIPIARFGVARLGVTSLLCREDRIWERLARLGGDGAQYVMGRIAGELKKMPREVWPIMAAYWSRPEFFAGVCSHLASVPQTVREMLNAQPIRGVPIMLFTPAESAPLDDAQLAQIGDNVRQIIAPACAHWIHLDQPEMVVDAIRKLATAGTTAARRQGDGSGFGTEIAPGNIDRGDCVSPPGLQ
jgi:pimeloyl-ACP methyl ester carboxylesterase